MPLPCLMASFLSASLALSASLMASKAAEDGNLSIDQSQPVCQLEPVPPFHIACLGCTYHS
jgi:hypothetical protein